MPLTVADMMANFEKTVEIVIAKIDRVFDKQWEARADVTRNVVSVGAVIFAGTVAFLEKNPPRGDTFEGKCLIASWLFLLASICAGLFVLWKSVALRRTHAIFINMKPHLQSQLAALNLGAPDIVQQSTSIIGKVSENVMNSVGQADKQAQAGTTICLVAFGASMLCFLVYALAKLQLFGT
jgi:hypothetical protein